MRWLWWLPLCLVVLTGAGWALWLGWIAATITETDVIVARAAEYVAETGGKATDCRGLPGQSPGIWLVVICEGGDMRHEWFVNRLGGVEHHARVAKGS